MALQDIKRISIRAYLSERGIKPQRETEHKGMYRSLFREDRNASFKVDYSLNVWRDFGSGEGGSIIDLVMRMENCTFYEAALRMERQYANIEPDSLSFRRDSQLVDATPMPPDEPAITIMDIRPITHPALVNFVSGRKISLELANHYCGEIHYRACDKSYFAIGFKNDRGGYELNSLTGFKAAVSPKDITTFGNGHETCLVFEGFFDFLSYLMLKNIRQTRHDVVVLNSVANVQKAMEFIKPHKDIYTYLDNDDGGRKATKAIQATGCTVYDKSAQYAGYNDLNDYLRQKPQAKTVVKKKGRSLRP